MVINEGNNVLKITSPKSIISPIKPRIILLLTCTSVPSSMGAIPRAKVAVVTGVSQITRFRRKSHIKWTSVITSANHAESMVKMQGYANAVLGPGWEKTGKTEEKRSRGGRTEEYVDPMTYEPPAGYETIPCGSKTCSNNLTPKSYPFMNAVKSLSGKGLPAKDQDRALCRSCFDSLKSGNVQGIETGVGTMVKVQDGNRVKIQLRQSGSASIADAQPVTEGANQQLHTS
jgi:hypothetical protein